jgi:RimJ/RimL family protein N-acetyltransferase
VCDVPLMTSPCPAGADATRSPSAFRSDRDDPPRPNDGVANGFRLRVRALRPTDRDALVTAFARLSERSRTQRFLAPKKELTDRDLTRLLDVDRVGRAAFAAINPADESIVGVARYCVSPERDDLAELAGAVVDAWQARGVGGVLLSHVVDRARENGITKLTAIAFSGNAAALKLLAHAGFSTTFRGYGVSELQLEVTQNGPSCNNGHDSKPQSARAVPEALAVQVGDALPGGVPFQSSTR